MPKPKMKLRKKQVVGQKMVKQGFEVCFKKKKKNLIPIWKLFPGKERKKDQNPERKLMLKNY